MTSVDQIATAALSLQKKKRGREPVDWTLDPVRFAHDRLGLFLWSKQREIIESVRDNRHTAVRACHDSGKSFLASVAAAWWLTAHPPGSAFVVSTAPSFPQVRAILWREIGRRHREGMLPGRVNQTEWHIESELVGFGRKPSDYDTAAFQGIHSEHVLVIIDEADGVPMQLFDAAETITTNEKCRILAIGNPDNPQSHFHHCQRPDSGWHVIHIDGLETPNFTNEVVPDAVRPMLLSPLWVEERKNDWGEDSPLFTAKVRGEYAIDADSGVVPLSWVRKCQHPETKPDGDAEPVKLEPVELGVDVGAGGDETVIQERRGPRAGRSWASKTPEVTQAVGAVMRAIRETGATAVKVDAIGVGWGVVGRLRELGRDGMHKADIVSVNVGNPASDPSKFPRLRDQLWWEIGRELSQSGGWDLTDIDETTVAQLIAPKYGIDSTGRVKVEPKLETIKRLGNSPDRADALLLAYYKQKGGGFRWLV